MGWTSSKIAYGLYFRGEKPETIGGFLLTCDKCGKSVEQFDPDAMERIKNSLDGANDITHTCPACNYREDITHYNTFYAKANKKGKIVKTKW